ncbi:MAG TPA: hypothetical protein VFH61_00400 [Thermoleophilia bacterium]|nr:hypothetical protein [Thermoleophilia bacterium]
MAEQQGPDTCLEAVELAFLNVTEAAALWRGITGEEVTPASCEDKCVSGELEVKGVAVTLEGGATWLTDMDSLLAYLDRTIMQQHRRIKEALEERRVELEGL